METKLSKEDLETLQNAFLVDGNGYDNKLSVNKDQFCRAAACIVNKGTIAEWGELFDKIDMRRDGLIDWDKFATHMMTELMERDEKVRSTQVPQWKDLKSLHNIHKDVIQRVMYLKISHKYIAVSKEGLVSIWDGGRLKLSRSIKAGLESCKAKDIWVTGCALLYNLNKIALAFTGKEIVVYDLSSKLDFQCQYRIQGLPHTPISLDYWSNESDANEAVLMWGDTGGGVHLIHFTSANIALFERPSGHHGTTSDSSDNIGLVVHLKEIGHKYRNARLLKHHGHTDWVRQVCYAPNLSCIVSCSSTWNNSVIFGWIEKDALKATSPDRKQISVWRVSRQSVVQISQGVNAFDYHDRLNILATAGVNNHVCLWNPYVISKPTGVLRGHMTSVTQVCFMKSRGQLASYSKDKVLRIWDIQLQVCIQRLSGMFLLKGPHDAMTTLFFDDAIGRLFITFNAELSVLEIKPEAKDRIRSHEKPVTAALYSQTYNQVVSASQDGTITIWQLENGQKLKQFNSTNRGTMSGAALDVELTCLSEDHSGTRLMTGATDGTVKIWDYNGHCYNTLQCVSSAANSERDKDNKARVDHAPAPVMVMADIGQILSLKRSVLVVGWTKYITVFRNQALHEFFVQASDWKGGQEHSDEIQAIAFQGTDLLVTGSYDGEIIVWNNGSEQASKRLDQRMRGSGGQDTSKLFTDTVAEEQGRDELNGDDSEGVFDSEKWVNERPRTRPKSRIASRISEGAFDENNEYCYAISKLLFLPTNGGSSRKANLVSCGGNGWVRFWSSTTAQLVAEFIAHPRVGSITMAVDQLNCHWLVTGDVDGVIKVWDISNYCTSDNGNDLLTETPELRVQFAPHLDMISSLEVINNDTVTLILSASTDCTVQLSDINGSVIGVFGQETYWKLVPTPDAQEVFSEKSSQKANDVVADAVENTQCTDEWVPDSRAVTDPKKFRVCAWNTTLIGKDYQELRVTKRERKQPGTIQDLYPLESARKMPSGPHSVLNTAELSNIKSLDKPDFVINPEKYFSEKVTETQRPVPKLSQCLLAAFDEKTLFGTKEIAEMEARMKLQSDNIYQKNVTTGRRAGNSVSFPVISLRSKRASFNSSGM